MPVRLSLAALLLGATPAPAVAQNAPSLIAKNLEARGGATALDALKSVQFTGRLIFPGDFELKYLGTRARLGPADAVRVDATLQGLDAVQAYDGRDGRGKSTPSRAARTAGSRR